MTCLLEREEHEKTVNTKALQSRRQSPWAHLAEEFRAEARKHNASDNALRKAFNVAQAEAYASWCKWEQEADQEDVMREIFRT